MDEEMDDTSSLSEFSRVPSCDACHNQFIRQILPPQVPRNMLQPDYYVTHVDIAYARECIDLEERELERYLRELDRLAQATQVIEKGRILLENRLFERRSLVTARRSLPSELWDEIFAHFVGSGPALAIEHDEVASPALLLSHVCSVWKRRATGNPRLWSSILINLGDILKGHEVVVEVYIRNSASQPLKINISDSTMRFEPLEEDELGVFKLLMGAMDRCVDLQFDGPVEQFDFIESSDTFAFPALVTFSRTELDGNDSERRLWKALQAAPNLTNISLAEIHSDREGFNYPQVKSLSIEYTNDLQYLFEGLVHFPEIESLEITRFNCDSDDASIPFRQFTSLKSLSIGTSNTETLDILFAHVTLPSLVSLEISSSDLAPSPARDWLYPRLLGLFERSGCSLQKLTINFIELGFRSAALRTLYETIPTLTHLEIAWNGGFRAQGANHMGTIKLLSDVSTARALLPKLTHLSLTRLFPRYSMRHLLNLVEARSTHRLREIGRDGDISALVEVLIPPDNGSNGAMKNVVEHFAEMRKTIGEQF